MKVKFSLKNFLIINLLAVAVLFLAVPAGAMSPREVVGNFTQNIKSKVDRLYLRLPGNKPGLAVLKQSALAMQKVGSFQMTLGLNTSLVNQDGSQMMTAKIDLSGPVEVKDVYDPAESKQDINLKGEVAMQGTVLKADADLKVDGQTTYLKINEAPVLPFFDLSQIKGEWLKLESTKMRDEQKEALSAEQRQQMQLALEDLMKAATLTEAKKEQQNGQGVFVIEANLPDSAIKAYVKRVAEISSEPNEKIEVSLQELDKFLSATEDFKIVLWIDRSSYYIVHLAMPMAVDVQKLQAETGASTASSMTPMGDLSELKSVKLDLNLDLGKFGQPINFSAPENARDFQEVIGELSSTMMGIPATTEVETKKALAPKPTELPELSAEEQKLLKQYGIEVEDL